MRKVPQWVWIAAGAGVLYWLYRQYSQAAADITAQNPEASFFETAQSIVQNVITNMTRGERNNNPGNIRKTATVWQGQAPDQTDPAFVVFTDPVYGIRALARILVNYSKAGVNTISSIIARWAPSSENDTNAYISAVSADMGVDPSTPLDVSDPSVLNALTAAIIHHENGRVSYTPDQIASGVNSALT